MALKLKISYGLDWLVLIIVAAAAGLLGRIAPHKRHFSLVDPSISYPFTEKELVPMWLAAIIAALMPAVVIAIVSMILVPGPTSKGASSSQVWRLRLWELHAGLLGLALSLIAALFFTETTKNIFGKPRPDMLSRCQPDLENLQKYVVGGFNIANMSGLMVSADICKQADQSKLNDGFRSYPSGHSSTAAGGLIYLTLYLASKLSVKIPIAMPSFTARAGPEAHAAFASSDGEKPPGARPRLGPLRSQAAAAPMYLLVSIAVPLCLGVFIASSRWYDYRHHGFDILFGFLMGTVIAIGSFRFYHIPISSGAGWAWGPRSIDNAFWAGVGRRGYVDDGLADKSCSEAPPVWTSDSTEQPGNTNLYPSQDVELGNVKGSHSVSVDGAPAAISR